MARADRSDTVAGALRRRRWVRRLVLLAVLALRVLAVLDRAGVFRYRGDDWGRFHGREFVVTRVIDGDTLCIRDPSGPDDKETKVRLVGVDAPELRPSPHHWAKQARGYLSERAVGQPVVLRLEPTQTRDQYGRLLAYVYLTEDDCLNSDLVRDGHAYADRRFAHTMRKQFEQEEDAARKAERGLWEQVTEGRMPEWRQKWLEKRRSRRRRKTAGARPMTGRAPVLIFAVEFCGYTALAGNIGRGPGPGPIGTFAATADIGALAAAGCGMVPTFARGWAES